MRTRDTLRLTVVTVLLGACGGTPGREEGAEHSSYLLIDAPARAAGFHLEGASAEDAVLPLELGEATEIDLVGPAGATRLPVAAGDLLHVRGAEGRLEWGTLGGDVDRDRLVVVGSEAAARDLADQLEGTIEASERGRFEIVGPGAFARGARASIPSGLAEAIPVKARGLAANRDDRGVARWLGDPAAVGWATGAGSGIGAGGNAGPRLASDVLLPPPVACEDAVEGTWVSREHYPEYGDWYVFTLEVRRDAREPERLHGTILSRSWTGEADMEVPMACSALPAGAHARSFDWTVRMQAEGEVAGDAFRFEGHAWRPQGARCGSPPPPWGYRLDSFAGTLAPGGQAFDALNNDGGRSIDDPHTFRRVACR
jgi:hypothetical protein